MIKIPKRYNRRQRYKINLKFQNKNNLYNNTFKKTICLKNKAISKWCYSYLS